VIYPVDPRGSDDTTRLSALLRPPIQVKVLPLAEGRSIEAGDLVYQDPVTGKAELVDSGASVQHRNTGPVLQLGSGKTLLMHPQVFDDFKRLALRMSKSESARVTPVAERTPEEHMSVFGNVYRPVTLAQVQLAAKDLREGRIDMNNFTNIAGACQVQTMEDERILDQLVSDAENSKIASHMAEVSRDVGSPMPQEEIEALLDKSKVEMLPEMYIDTAVKQPVVDKKYSLAELARLARGERP